MGTPKKSGIILRGPIVMKRSSRYVVILKVYFQQSSNLVEQHRQMRKRISMIEIALKPTNKPNIPPKKKKDETQVNQV